MKKSGLEIFTARAVPALLIIYCIFLIIFGIRYHVMELPGTAEFDGYTLKADEIRSGSLPHDLYRPLLYPVLTAAVGEAVNDTFAGGRLVSSMFACLFVLFAWRIGRLVFGEPAASITALLLILNFHVMTFGLSVSTDMTFTALVSGVLLISLMIVKRPGAGLTVLAGFLFAAAFFSRYSAVFILPVPVVAILISDGDRSRRDKLLLSAVFIAASILFLVPHFVLNTKVFGSPLYNENWKNVAFKLYGDKDWSYFSRIQFGSLSDVIREDPARWLRSSLKEFARFFSSTLYFMGGKGAAGFLFLAMGTLGIAAMILRIDRKRFIVLLFIILLAAGGSMTFFSGVRFMLPVMGLYYMAIAGFLKRSGHVAVLSASLVAVLAILTIYSSVRHIDMYIDAHPVEELEASRLLESEYGTGIVVLGTFPYMQRYLTCGYSELKDSDGKEMSDISTYFDSMDKQIVERGAQFVIVGRASLSRRPAGLLMGTDFPDFLSLVSIDEYVTVYRVTDKTEM